MLKVNKEQEPDFLLEYKKKYTPKSWTDYNKDDIRNKIKENILTVEQGNIVLIVKKEYIQMIMVI